MRRGYSCSVVSSHSQDTTTSLPTSAPTSSPIARPSLCLLRPRLAIPRPLLAIHLPLPQPPAPTPLPWPRLPCLPRLWMVHPSKVVHVGWCTPWETNFLIIDGYSIRSFIWYTHISMVHMSLGPKLRLQLETFGFLSLRGCLCGSPQFGGGGQAHLPETCLPIYS